MSAAKSEVKYEIKIEKLSFFARGHRGSLFSDERDLADPIGRCFNIQ